MLRFFLLSVMVHGPLRDPTGLNFPESRLFHDAATLPKLFSAGRGHLGFVFALIFAVLGTWVVKRWHLGFEMRVTGLSTTAAKFAGYNRDRTVWMALLIGGGMSGFAGVVRSHWKYRATSAEYFPIVWIHRDYRRLPCTRLHPFAVIPAGLLVALSYLAGRLLNFL